MTNSLVPSIAPSIVEAWLAHLGYTEAEIATAMVEPDHRALGCEFSHDYGWRCLDEEGVSNHPWADEADSTAALVMFVLERAESEAAAAEQRGYDRAVALLRAESDRQMDAGNRNLSIAYAGSAHMLAADAPAVLGNGEQA